MNDAILSSGRALPAADAGLNRRFFLAVEDLVSRGRLDSLSSLGRECGCSAGKLRELRTVFGPAPSSTGWCRYRHVDMSVLSFLVTRYGVSGSWLLAGVGSMYGVS